MNSVSILFILIGIFIILNSSNFVGVIQGNKKIQVSPPNTTGTTSPTGPNTAITDASGNPIAGGGGLIKAM